MMKLKSFLSRNLFTRQYPAIVFTLVALGCHSYFKVASSEKPYPEKIAGFNQSGKSIVMHFNNRKWVLTDVNVKNDSVTGFLNDYQMPPTFNPVRTGKPNRYFTRASHNQRYLLNEVHIYLDKSPVNINNLASISVSEINRIEIYNKDKAATVGSWILGGVTIILGIATISVVAIIASLGL